jgi:hypothetical protein
MQRGFAWKIRTVPLQQPQEMPVRSGHPSPSHAKVPNHFGGTYRMPYRPGGPFRVPSPSQEKAVDSPSGFLHMPTLELMPDCSDGISPVSALRTWQTSPPLRHNSVYVEETAPLRSLNFQTSQFILDRSSQEKTIPTSANGKSQHASSRRGVTSPYGTFASLPQTPDQRPTRTVRFEHQQTDVEAMQKSAKQIVGLKKRTERRADGGAMPHDAEISHNWAGQLACCKRSLEGLEEALQIFGINPTATSHRVQRSQSLRELASQVSSASQGNCQQRPSWQLAGQLALEALQLEGAGNEAWEFKPKEAHKWNRTLRYPQNYPDIVRDMPRRI